MFAISDKALYLRAVELLTIAGVLLPLALGCRASSETLAEATVNPPLQEEQYVADSPHDTLPSIERVSLEEARSLFDSGTATFVDVRGREDFDAAHIPGALSIPLGLIGGSIDSLDSNAVIITYCA